MTVWAYFHKPRFSCIKCYVARTETGVDDSMKFKKHSPIRRIHWTKTAVLAVFVGYICFLAAQASGQQETLFRRIIGQLQDDLYLSMVQQYMPSLAYVAEGREDKDLTEAAWEKIMGQFPLFGYVERMSDYQVRTESSLSDEEIIALEGKDEQAVSAEDILEAARQENDGQLTAAAESENAQALLDGAAQTDTQQAEQEQNTADSPDAAPASSSAVSSQPQVVIPREKLNDFDYLIQNFYQVDNTTTIDSSRLSAETLLNMDLSIKTPADQPQILIYHTHSQEFFADSDPSDVMTGVVGVGEYLTQLLRDEYGFNVIHHMGQYDVNDRDHAYANADGPIEQILAENPSIEVVIDLHRDAVEKHMVREVNGVEMAPIMFFNGLSHTKALGDIPYLQNPNLTGNLAFSLQMQLAAAEYYPNLTRPIYLKGYRYNMHFKEKCLLIEMGSYTNTQQEAWNAMVPLADLLDKVLHDKI